MTERFEDRLWVALESVVRSIPQDSISTERRPDIGRRRLALVGGGIAVAAAVLVAVIAWPNRPSHVVVVPERRATEAGPVPYLAFPSESMRRDMRPQMSPEELRRFDADQQRFVERGADRNRATLFVSKATPSAGHVDELVTRGGVRVAVSVRSKTASAFPLEVSWELGGQLWLINDVMAEQRHLDDEEMLAFIDSLHLDGDRLATEDDRFEEVPPPVVETVWEASTESGSSISASRWLGTTLADQPGTPVRVRGTDGLLYRGWDESPTSVLWWQEAGLVMSLSVQESAGNPAPASELVRVAESLRPIPEREFMALPVNPAMGWGSDGEVVVRLPDAVWRDGEQIPIHTLQRAKGGEVVAGSQYAWLTPASTPASNPTPARITPPTIAVRVATEAVEVVVWIGGSSTKPPTCAQPIAVRSGQPAHLVDLVVDCNGQG